MTKNERKHIVSSFLRVIEELSHSAIDDGEELEDPIQEIRRAVDFLEHKFRVRLKKGSTHEKIHELQ